MKLFITLAACLLNLSTLSAAEKPNILFIFADDFAYDCVGFNGNSEVKTPNLDRLAKRSTRFTHAYNPGGWHGAICMASRAMLMSGKQLWPAQKLNHKEMLQQREFFPQRMQDQGYQTFYTGKWHVGKDSVCQSAWVNARNIRPGMPKPVNQDQYNRTFKEGDDTWSPTDKSQGGFWKGGTHWSEVIPQDSAEFFKQVKDKENPFCMMLAFNAPHDPRQSPQEFLDLYDVDKIKVPENFVPTYPWNFGDRKVRDERLAPFPRTERSIQVNRLEYYALISHTDAQVGKILDQLDASGKADNTIIIFTADHGLACGHHGLLGKQNQHDPSIRVPFIIAGPGIPEGISISKPIYLQDAMATCLDIAGSEVETDFQSILPLIKDPEIKPRPYITNAYRKHQRMIIKDGYKLILYPQVDVTLLYNMEEDPLEMNNLAEDPAQAEKIKTLRGLLIADMKQAGDPLQLD